MNEAIRDWITNVETTHYLIGSAAARIRTRRSSATSSR